MNGDRVFIEPIIDKLRKKEVSDDDIVRTIADQFGYTEAVVRHHLRSWGYPSF